jgi:hypothetical protein
MKRLWLVIALLLVAATVSAQEFNIDPNSQLTGGSSGSLPFFDPLGQSFTAVTADIRWIGMFIGNCLLPKEFQLTLLEGSGTSGPVISTQTAIVPGGLFGFFYFDFNGTTLTVGNAYTAVLSLISPTSFDCSSIGVYGTSKDVYSGGTAFASGEANNFFDFYLRVLTAIFAAQVRPPLSPDGSSTFSAKTAVVIPVKFALTADSAPTCELPPAEIAVYGGFQFRTLLLQAPFRISECQYIYNLPIGSLSPGRYRIKILLTNSTPTPLQVSDVLFTVASP